MAALVVSAIREPRVAPAARVAELEAEAAGEQVTRIRPVRVDVRSLAWVVVPFFAFAFLLEILGWIIAAVGRAPYMPLWQFAPWQMWVPNVAMPFVCLLLAFGIAIPNPLSIASRNDEAFDPDQPGIVGVTRHPMLWATALWAFAHAVPKGDLAHVLLFGGFAIMALAGMFAIDARHRRR